MRVDNKIEIYDYLGSLLGKLDFEELLLAGWTGGLGALKCLCKGRADLTVAVATADMDQVTVAITLICALTQIQKLLRRCSLCL